MVKKKEMISLKDSKPWFDSGIGGRAQHPQFGILTMGLGLPLQLRLTPTAQPERGGGSDCRRTKGSTRDRAGCHLYDSILGQAACSW